MSCQLYYGIILSQDEYFRACGDDFVFESSIIRNVKDWLQICDIFHKLQLLYKLDYNISKILLNLYLDNLAKIEGTFVSIHVPPQKISERKGCIAIDKYDYSEFYDSNYYVDYDFCELSIYDFDYEDGDGIVLGVELLPSINPRNREAFSFDIDELKEFMNLPAVIKFHEGLRNHPKLCNYKPRYIMTSSD